MASFPSVPCEYEVFLNFRGEDVRHNFLSHLCKALKDAGINTFIDDKELERGKEIIPELLEAIERSTIAITVFSKNYGDSKSCLDELVKILDCRDKLGQVVLPIFFHVDPSDVCNQRGSFGEGFAVHQGVAVERIESWKAALSKAGKISGYEVNRTTRNEAEVIETIIKDVSDKLPPTYLSDVDRLFGIEHPVRNIISLLRLDSEEVRFVGIYGMAGIGKTTVAKVIRNRIWARFDGNSLLEDVQQAGSRYGGLVELQKKLLTDIIRSQGHVSDIDDGIDKIRRRLKNKRVLIILDNVDDLKQLDALAKEKIWFGIGSRIIVTCRDEHLLNGSSHFDAKHEVLSLNFHHGRQLFSWHAFRQLGPPSDYADCALEIMRYAGGHPLALKVLGSFLSDKTDLSEWTSASKELKCTQPGKIFETLKMCFDSLGHEQKNTFLDIAFFFLGMDKDDAIQILNGCPGFKCIHVHTLTQKCLLTISKDKKLGMHNLLQDMATEIVRRENHDKPGERSRLNSYKDVRKVLKYNQGTNKVVGFKGIFPELREKPFKTEALAKMNGLRILQLRNARFGGGCEHLSEELRWLYWERYPWESVTLTLNLKRLVVLELRCSNLQHLWEQTKVLKKLKILDLSHSHNFIRTSDISGLSSVEKLIFKDGINLTEIHQSIGKLSKLIYLDLENCKNLVSLPQEICKLSFLENLNLYLCSKLKELPEDIGNMERLKELNIGCTAIRNLPISISHLKNLKTILCNNERSLIESPGDYDLSPLWSLASVTKLNLSFCNLSDTSLPGDLGGLPNLVMLFLKGNTFHCLPTCLSRLPKLKMLDVSECDLSGTRSPMVLASPSLEQLDLSENKFCRLAVDLTSLPRCSVFLSGCKKIQAIEARSSARLHVYDCTSLEKLTFKGGLNNNLLVETGRFKPICLGYYSGCEKLVEIEGNFKLKPLTGGQLDKLERLFGLESLLNKQLHFYNPFTFTCIERPIQELWDHGGQISSIFIPGGMIPDWFNHQNNGEIEILVDVPRLSSGSFRAGFAVCVAYKSFVAAIYAPDSGIVPILCMTIEDINSSGYYYKYSPKFIPFPDEDEEVMWISYWRAATLMNECDRFKVKVRTLGREFQVQRIGVRLLHDEYIDPQLSGVRPLHPPRLRTFDRGYIRFNFTRHLGFALPV